MSTESDDPRVQLARSTVGEVTAIADPALPLQVLRLADSLGNVYFAKQHERSRRYAQEVRAYTTWVRHLHGHAPTLVGRQDATRTLLLTAVHGQGGQSLPPGSPEEEQAHHDAGHVLRSLHRGTAGRSAGALSIELATRLRSWIAKAERAGLLSRVEHRLLNRISDELAGTPMDSAVCHLDYQPQNWITGDEFRVIDMEHMRRDARVRDFARLEFRRWQAAPHLRDAFFEGYGSRPSATEQRLLERFGAIEAATSLVRGHEQDDSTLTAHGRTVLSRLS
ncbi:aminoglycoside phosphotransferase [Streptomyces sp. NPDC053048]|uniref:aminoglycoside phosphotransferase n=1 Tax=Streptomyces sp. NPDC053048 TaxID=3365694 RepID=UPI0037D5572A